MTSDKSNAPEIPDGSSELTPCDRPYSDCGVCKGTGKHDGDPCPACVWRRWFEDATARGAVRSEEEIMSEREEARTKEALPEDGARCHRCGHYETRYTHAVETYAHCPSCGRHTRWERVPCSNEAQPAPKASCGWCRGNPIGHCHICQAKPSTPETYADDVEPRTDSARPHVCPCPEGYHGYACKGCGGEAEYCGKCVPRTDSACSDLDLDVVNEVKDRIQAELDDDRADDRTRSVLCAARGVLRAVLVSQQRTEPASPVDYHTVIEAANAGHHDECDCDLERPCTCAVHVGEAACRLLGAHNVDGYWQVPRPATVQTEPAADSTKPDERHRRAFANVLGLNLEAIRGAVCLAHVNVERFKTLVDQASPLTEPASPDIARLERIARAAKDLHDAMLRSDGTTRAIEYNAQWAALHHAFNLPLPDQRRESPREPFPGELELLHRQIDARDAELVALRKVAEAARIVSIGVKVTRKCDREAMSMLDAAIDAYAALESSCLGQESE